MCVCVCVCVFVRVCVCIVSSGVVESSEVDTSTGLLKNDLDSLPVCACACACACSFHRHSNNVQMCAIYLKKIMLDVCIHVWWLSSLMSVNKVPCVAHVLPICAMISSEVGMGVRG